MNKSLYAIKLDGRRDRPTFNKFKIHTTPTTMIVTSDGEVFGEMPGYLPTADWLRWASELVATGEKIDKWKREAKDKPDDADLWKRIGDEYVTLKIDAKAIDAYAKALELNDQRPSKEETRKFKGDVLTLKGFAHFRKQDPAEKLKDIYRAIYDIDVDGKLELRDNAMLLRGLYGALGGEGVDAAGVVEDGMSRYGKSDSVDGFLFLKGYLAWKDGEKAEATKILTDVVEQYPNSFFRSSADAIVQELTAKKKAPAPKKK